MSRNKATTFDGFSDRWIKKEEKFYLFENLWSNNII